MTVGWLQTRKIRKMTVTEEDIQSWYSIPLAQEVRNLLTPISKDPDFICSALAFCDTEETRKKLLNEIKTKNLTKYGEVINVISEIRKGNI